MYTKVFKMFQNVLSLVKTYKYMYTNWVVIKDCEIILWGFEAMPEIYPFDTLNLFKTIIIRQKRQGLHENPPKEGGSGEGGS